MLKCCQKRISCYASFILFNNKIMMLICAIIWKFISEYLVLERIQTELENFQSRIRIWLRILVQIRDIPSLVVHVNVSQISICSKLAFGKQIVIAYLKKEKQTVVIVYNPGNVKQDRDISYCHKPFTNTLLINNIFFSNICSYKLDKNYKTI